jgi:DNA repair exonuclease SbcCD nuclease subunit
VKFVHAADLHIDSVLRGLVRYPGAPYERLRGATRRAFSALIQTCLEEQPDALVLSGDIFDRDWPDYNTGLFFMNELLRLREVGTVVLMVRGNHDARNRMTKELSLPDHVRVFDHRRAETHVVGGFAFHGQSFADARVTVDLSLGFPRALTDYVNVGVLHTSLDGREGHEPYAPTSAAKLRERGYDYWALGHVHTREVVASDPYIVFPGNLQGRHAREVGPKGATVVRARPQGLELEARVLSVLEWSVVRVDARDARELIDLIDLARAPLADLSRDTFHAVRIEFHGVGDLSDVSHADDARFRSELCALAATVGDIWVEKVTIRTRGSATLESLSSRDDAPGALARYLLREDTQDGSLGEPGLTHDVRDALAELQRELPSALFSSLDTSQLAQDVRLLIVSKLLQDGIDGGDS